MATPESKLNFLQEAEALIAGFSGKAERELYSMRVAEMVGVSPDAVRQDVELARKRNGSRARRQAEKQEMNLTGKSPVRSVRYEHTRSAMAEEGIIRLLYLDPQLFDSIDPPDPEEFTVPQLRNIYRVLSAHTRTGTASLASLSGSLSTEEAALLTNLLQKPEIIANGQTALSDYIDILRTEQQNREQSDNLLELAERLRKKKGYLDPDPP